MTRGGVVAIIPARGGSRRLPRKNLRTVGGRSLIAHAVEAARKARLIDRVIVSTDDARIAAMARRCGAEVPFRRPVRLSGSLTPDLPVFQHALDWLARHQRYAPDIVVHVRPTAPLRRPEDLDAAVRLLRRHPQADSVRSVSVAGQHPWKVWRIVGGRLRPWVAVNGHREPYNLPRQRLEPAYAHNGVVDAVRSRVIRRGSMSGRRMIPLVTAPARSIDVDEPHELWLVRHLWSRRSRTA